MVRKIFLVVSIFLLTYLSFSFFREYFAYHTYYYKMLENWNSTKIVLNSVIFALIPAAYVMFSKRRNFRVTITTIFVAMYGYGLVYISSKASLMGGAMKFFFNTLIILAIALFFVGALLVVGDRVKEKVLKGGTNTIYDIIINLGIGMAVFLIINYILIMLNLFYPILSWLQVIAVGFLMWLRRDSLSQTWQIADDTISGIAITRFHHIWHVVLAAPFIAFGVTSITANDATFWSYACLAGGGLAVFSYIWKALGNKDWGLSHLMSAKFWLSLFALLLLVLSFMYLDMGYILAYIPYSTAWDANHAYMFFPRMWALNHGYFWDEWHMRAGPQFWYVYIAYWFSLFVEMGGIGSISADTIAIQMNFWSGIFVLIFGLGLVSEFVAFLGDRNKSTDNKIVGHVAFLVGWFLILQWLFSGMGAFLVFIDNKTDLGVLSLIVLAVYTGFVVLRNLHKAKDAEGEEVDTSLSVKLIALSGFFYAIAVLAKPTGAFDVVNFGLLYWWMHFGVLGVIALFVGIVGVMSALEFRWMPNYIPAEDGKYLLWALPVALVDIVRLFMKKSFQTLKYFGLWAATFVLTVVLLKGPFVLYNNAVYDLNLGGSDIIKNIFLSHNDKESNLQTSDMIPLYAQAGNLNTVDTCNLQALGMSDVSELYKTTQKAPGDTYSEDVGRYVGYGWKGGATDARRGIKPFTNPIWAFPWGEGCHTFNPLYLGFVADAKELCETENDWKSWDAERMKSAQSKLVVNGDWYNKLDDLIEAIPAGGATAQQMNLTYGNEINEIDTFMQDNTIKVVMNDKGDKLVYVPYRFLNFFNISFNWSIQNLSSYYTDIGLVWVMCIIFTFVGLLYGIFRRNSFLTGISLVTLCGWFLWHFVAGGILWYAIGIIIWTIIAFVCYVYTLLIEERQDGTFLGYVFVLSFIIFGGVQMVLNLQRVASQGGGGAFVWYKTNYGIRNEFGDNLARTSVPTSRFGRDDVFMMQFPHYRDFIDLANRREDDEGALIAGTYSRYFVDDQHHVKYDQFLTWLYEMTSDQDACKSYLRLKDQHIKYLVVDPNIGTVVQGAGNQSLFERFFAKIDNSNDTIINDGVFTMISRLYEGGYVKFVSSNNIGAKYAYSMPDETFVDMEGDARILFRTRMALMRFFGGSNSPMFDAVANIAYQRAKDGTFITDIADMMGLQIRDNRLITLARQPSISASDVTELTDDERNVLGQFLNLRSITDDAKLNEQVRGVVSRGLGGGNQVIVLELVDF